MYFKFDKTFTVHVGNLLEEGSEPAGISNFAFTYRSTSKVLTAVGSGCKGISRCGEKSVYYREYSPFKIHNKCKHL